MACEHFSLRSVRLLRLARCSQQQCGGRDSNLSRSRSLAASRLAHLPVPGSNPFESDPRRSRCVSAAICGGRDSNPRTSTGADLKSAAFGQAQPPPRRFGYRRRGQTPFGCRGDVRRGSVDPSAPTSLHQSTESVPSPCGSGAISSSVRRSTTWITPRSFFAGHTSAARTFSSSSSSPM